MAIKLNLGCGKSYLQGWINVDVSTAYKVDQCADLRQLPFPDGYADEIMAIHVIEHFYRWEVDDLLREWFRVLKPGGKLILECPDLNKAIRNILEGQPDQMGMWALYGDWNHKDPLMMHKHGWSAKALSEVLGKFSEVVAQKPAQYHKKDLRDMRIEAIK